MSDGDRLNALSTPDLSTAGAVGALVRCGWLVGNIVRAHITRQLAGSVDTLCLPLDGGIIFILRVASLISCLDVPYHAAGAHGTLPVALVDRECSPFKALV